MLRMRTLQEGSVGLFALFGLIIFGGLVVWLRGGIIGQKTYQFFAEFKDVSGLQIGAPVRYRGVAVGKILGLQPSSNGVTVAVEISSAQLRIPKGSTVQINRYGLIGEASVDITPSRELSEDALSIDPTSEDCEQAGKILCNNDQVTGKTGSQLVEALTRLSNAYSDPEFVGNMNAALQNVATAGGKVATLSEEVTKLSKAARGEIGGVSDVLRSADQAAQDASQLMRNVNTVVAENRTDLNRTVSSAANLISNLDGLVSENRGNIVNTLDSIQRTSDQVRFLALNFNTTVDRLNEGIDEIDMAKLANDLETLMTNAAQTSENLQNLSQSLNDPEVLLTIQKTLDSARVTFENTQKITSDVEELTGDPTFRNNIRKLIDGLSNLVAYTEQLEQQVYVGQVIESVSDRVEYSLLPNNKLKSFSPEEKTPARLPKRLSNIKKPLSKTETNITPNQRENPAEQEE
ncbi:MlaD family protein [Cyanothece sp. BG0011]|uniref:MlaD family protein n=1 Tax=Cyanothece sp. BG0011 TaxID=2082950 RepID=UPI000D1F321E|nr:MlaD family protein [Cyanothece sp. BG0011]